MSCARLVMTPMCYSDHTELFSLATLHSRFTELVMSGKSIAAALGLLHSGTRLLDS